MSNDQQVFGISGQPAELLEIANDLATRIARGDYSSYEDYRAKLIENLTSRHWIEDSPGWRAFFTPGTILDKSFQIFTLYWLKERDYAFYFPHLHKREILAQDVGVVFAQKYLVRHCPEFIKMKENRESITGLKDIIYVEYSHQLPPGNSEWFPKYAKRLGTEQQKFSDILFWNGQLAYIRAHPETQLDRPTQYQPLNDFGALEAVYREAEILAKHISPAVAFPLENSVQNPQDKTVEHPVRKRASKKKVDDISMSLF